MEHPDLSPTERLRTRVSSFTTAERRVAEVLDHDPALVAFGTVAEVATTAGAGAATVVRLANKLGYDGFSSLQDAVRTDVVGRLRPAAERIRSRPGGDRLGTHLTTEVDNVRRTLGAVDGDALERATTRLADDRVAVFVVAGNASIGVASQFAGELALLRDGIRQLLGDEVAVRRDLALAPPEAVLVAVDLDRYDQWLVEVVKAAAVRRWPIVAVTDGPLSPLAEDASEVFTVAAGTIGPFDSHVGIVSLLGLLVAEVAVRRAGEATSRLDAVERAWTGALTTGGPGLLRRER